MGDNLVENNDILSDQEYSDLIKIIKRYKKNYNISKEELKRNNFDIEEYKRDTIRNTIIKNIKIVEDLLFNGLGTLEVQNKYNISRVGLGQSVLSLKNFNIGRKLTPTMLKKTYDHQNE